MKLVKPPKVLTDLLLRKLIWQMPAGKKQIFITFDDGPVPEITPEVLRILSSFKARATFFCVGENVSKHPQVYEQILKAGHKTGNHTYNHLNGWKTRQEDYLQNIARCRELINSNLFRPPYGRINPWHIPVIKKQGYKIVMWSVLTQDYDASLTAGQVLDNALKYTNDGSIVVFHDSVKAADRMLYALQGFLEHFGKKGYRFEALPDDFTAL
ncbi:polysaccharide deacetylase family protein [Lentimicrobium sp.]